VCFCGLHEGGGKFGHLLAIVIPFSCHHRPFVKSREKDNSTTHPSSV
jgi:hypothetical protein